MRTTIDPRQNLASTSPKSGRRPSGESASLSQFDDALKFAQPREQAHDEASAVESQKANEPKRKAISKKEKSDDLAPVDEAVEASQTQEKKDAKPAIEGEQATETEVTAEDADPPVVVKDENEEEPEIKDPLGLNSLLTAPAQPAEAPDTEMLSEVAEECAVVDVVAQPQSKSGGQISAASSSEETKSDGTPAAQVAGTKPVQTEGESNHQESSMESEEPEESDSGESTKPSESRDVSPTIPKAAEAASSEVRAMNDPAQTTEVQPTTAPVTAGPKTPAPAAPETPTHVAQDARFADDNHPQIVTGIRGELLPTGGKMTLRLDPPELGALQVQVHMQDGAMTATFQTSNDEATRLLSHSLANLKNSLEAQGIHVDKLQVQQAPRDQQSSNNSDSRDSQQQSPWDNPSAKQEQQRREMLQRMWRKLAGVEDPLDLVA